MKLTYAIKEKKQNVEPKWFEGDFEVLDVTGDFGILIVRVYGKEADLRGLWLEYKNEEWRCLQEDVDNRMIEMLINHPKVVQHLNTINY